MGLQVKTEKCLVWDDMTRSMEMKTAVTAQIVGNLGTVFFEEGPLYCNNDTEVKEASEMLKRRLVKWTTTGKI